MERTVGRCVRYDGGSVDDVVMDTASTLLRVDAAGGGFETATAPSCSRSNSTSRGAA